MLPKDIDLMFDEKYDNQYLSSILLEEDLEIIESIKKINNIK